MLASSVAALTLSMAMVYTSESIYQKSFQSLEKITDLLVLVSAPSSDLLQQDLLQ